MRSGAFLAAVLAVSAAGARAQTAPPRPPLPTASWASPIMIPDPVPRGVVSRESPAALLREPGADGSVLGRVVRDLSRGAWELAGDGWHVVTVPTRMDTGDAGVLAGVLGVGGLLYVWDEGLFDALRRQEGHGLHDGLLGVGEFVEPMGLMGNTNRWYALGVVAGYLAGWDPLLHVSRDLLASHWLAAATYNPPRTWIGRSRPYEGLGAHAFQGGTSLPSGHASSIVQVAAVLSHHVGWTPATVVFWGLAGTVLLQRVDSEAHWPSDVWIGAAWGYGVSRLVLARAEARRRPPEAEPGRPGVRIVPFVDAGSGRPGVAVRLPVGPG